MRHLRRLALFSLVGLALEVLGCKPMAHDEVPGPRLVLVAERDGAVPIILPKEPLPRNREAAEELAAYLEKISGQRPEILEGAPEPLPPGAIWVGHQPAVEPLFPKVDFAFPHPEEILIAASPEHLVIAGRDRWDPQRMTLALRNATVSGIQQEYGTANAVQTFIQEYLGVRWLWPGTLGEDVPQMREVAFAPFVYRYHPPFRSRTSLFRLSALGDSRGQAHQWTRQQRLQLDSLQFEPLHAFSQWWERFNQTHPDYFALQPDGTRSLSGLISPHAPSLERAAGRVKICLSNPAVWEQWLADATQSIEGNPRKALFSGAENDSATRGICVCAACKSWDVPREETYSYTWANGTREDVVLSDRYVRFWNTLARKLKERFPDEPYYVVGGAYGPARALPVKEKPAENVITLVVGNSPGFNKADTARESAALITGWGGLGKIIWRPNLWGRAGRWGLPEVAIGGLSEPFRLAADHQCVGLYFDTVWEHWATHGPQLYLMAQLAWNPYADEAAVLKDYYARAFGPAAPEMERYWNQMAGRFDTTRVQPTGLTPAFLQASRQLLDQATAKVARAPQKYRERIAFVRGGLDFTETMLAYLDLKRDVITRLQSDKPVLAGARQQMKVAWQKVEAWSRKHPLAISPQPLGRAQAKPITPLGERLEIEYLSNLRKETNTRDAQVDVDAPEGNFDQP